MSCCLAGRDLPSRVAVFIVWLAVAWGFASHAYPWGGEHSRISAVALDALPQEEQEYLRPERSALVAVYCTFPDINWPCYGQWGSGTGDPRAPRMPDTRRLWEVSFYTGWDPVLQKGKGYPHAPPQSWEAAEVSFLRAAHALREGRLEDGCRCLGVMLHYIQDTGSFPYVQPIHRVCHVKDPLAIRMEGGAPCRLGQTPEQAAKALSERVAQLVETTGRRMAPLVESAGMPWAEARRLASRETMPVAVVEIIGKVRAQKPAEFEAVAVACANECVRVCADAIHSALAFAEKPRAEPPCPAPNVNLVFNASLEEDDGDGVPDGWCVGWFDLVDRVGRAEWYRRGTHWEKLVHSGNRSLLVLWPPKKGIQWQQTWPKAVRVGPGETYRGSVWARGTVGHLALEFSDTNYQAVHTAKSGPLAGSTGWQRLTVEASTPSTARWLRVLLFSNASEGAAWFDDVEVVRVPSP